MHAGQPRSVPIVPTAQAAPSAARCGRALCGPSSAGGWGERPGALMCSAAGQPLLGAKQPRSRPGCAPPAPYGRGRCYRAALPVPRIEMEMKPSVLPADTGTRLRPGQRHWATPAAPAPQRSKGGGGPTTWGTPRDLGWETRPCPHATRGARGWLVPAAAHCWRRSWRAPGRPAALKGIPAHNVPGLPAAAGPPPPDGG